MACDCQLRGALGGFEVDKGEMVRMGRFKRALVVVSTFVVVLFASAGAASSAVMPGDGVGTAGFHDNPCCKKP